MATLIFPLTYIAPTVLVFALLPLVYTVALAILSKVMHTELEFTI